MNNKATWYRDPLSQYLVIGLVLAAGFLALRGDDDVTESVRRIDVGATEVQWLHRNWQARWQRPPTEVELRGLVDSHVREEVLYRTGVAMGLDRGDGVIRRRIRPRSNCWRLAAICDGRGGGADQWAVRH